MIVAEAPMLARRGPRLARGLPLALAGLVCLGWLLAGAHAAGGGRAAEHSGDLCRRSCGLRHRGVWQQAGAHAEHRSAGGRGHAVRSGVLQLAGLHGLAAVVVDGPLSAFDRRDAAGNAAAGRRTDAGRDARRPGLRHGGHRQDALQQRAEARLRRCASTCRSIAAGSRRQPPAERREEWWCSRRGVRSKIRRGSGSTASAGRSAWATRRWTAPSWPSRPRSTWRRRASNHSS